MNRIRSIAAIVAGGALVLALAGACTTAGDWRSASAEPAGLAPHPVLAREALVQVYAARTRGWRGVFGVHTWIAVKPTDAGAYRVYEVIGWRLRSSPSVVAVRERQPDARWYGSLPELIAQKRGAGVDAIIERIDKAATGYPYADRYTVWPGPNSNTFTAWVLRAVPELTADLPPTAIGKDYLGERIASSAPSGSGYQLSFLGLLADELDAVVFASAPESPLVHMLLMTPGVKLFEFPQAEAYSRKIRYLNPVVLPRGIADIARDMPPHDVPLVSPTCSLVAREGTHPALVQLFVQAAHKIHGGSSWFARAGQFPTAQSADLPLAKEAERYYRNGPPLLQRYLPFWLANLVDRMWVALFSIAALLIPLARVVPPLYEFRIRSRVFRWYLNLRHIEDALNRKSTPPAELLEQLNRLDAKAELTKVPLSYADQLYSLRSHIQLVRDRLQQS